MMMFLRLVLNGLADGKAAVDVGMILRMKLGSSSHRVPAKSMPVLLALVPIATRMDPSPGAEERVNLGVQRWANELLREVPELAPAPATDDGS